MTRNGTQDKPRASIERTPREDRGPISEASLRLAFFPRYALTDWRLDRPTLRVLMALSCFTSGETGQVRPAQETIGAIAGLRRPRVNEIIADLVELGYLVKLDRQDRCVVYQVVNPEIPTQGTVPPGGTRARARKAQKNFPQGGHDPVPPGGTPPVPPGGTQTSLTCENRGNSPSGEEDDRCAHERGADAPLSAPSVQGAGADAPSGPPSGVPSARVQSAVKSATKFLNRAKPKDYNPLSVAASSMSRQDVGALIARAGEVGNEEALREFGFDYRGKPFPPPYQIDLEEAIDHARQAAQPKP